MPALDKAARALDMRLARVRDGSVDRPPRGWLRAIRDALGLTTKQLARRLGVSQPRIVALEKGEIEETVTLASLRRAAEALDCRLIYALVPDRPLVDTLRERVEKVADAHMARLNHTMRLENQALASDDQRRQRDNLVDALLRGGARRLWDDDV